MILVNKENQKKKRGRPAVGRGQPFQMRVTDQWLARLDEWRRKQEDMPTRTEAARRLVEQALSSKR